MKALSLGKRITAVLLCASLAGGLFTGCKKGDDMFPSIEYANGGEGASEEPEETAVESDISDIQQLTVALPYSDLTVQCLAAMYYSKNRGLWDSSETGLTIDTDYLSSIATNSVVYNIGCGSTGVSMDTVREWNSDGGVPDLFLVQDSEAVWKSGFIQPLNTYLSDNSYLSSQQIYAGALTNDSENGQFYAVPHFCSAEIIMGSMEYVPAGSGKLQTKNTTGDLRDYLVKIADEHPECAGFASAYDLIPYLGSAFNGDVPTSYMVFSEYRKDPEKAGVVINDAATYVYLSQGYFTRAFKDEIGVSPMNYLMNVRISKACELLKNEDIKVSAIATAVGFSSAQRFNVAFKKNKGITPMDYRKQFQKE